MSQPKLQLELPTKLTLHHFLQTAQIGQVVGSKTQEKQCNSRLVQRLKAMVPDGGSTHYSKEFVMSFLLIKLNSWIAHSSFSDSDFINLLIRFYNGLREDSPYLFKSSRNDGELMSQILLESHASEWVSEQQIEEMMEGSALVGATAVQALRHGKWLNKQCYLVIVLGLISLHGRTNPYIPIVHKEKNHPGQIEFASRINALIHLNPKTTKFNLEMIQDAYSLRCTPQVHGVSLESLKQLENAFEGLVNRPQTRYITVKGRRMRNLALRAESETMLLDQLIMSLNEVGHMSFLRAERILNRHLGKNDIQNSEHYEYLRIQLKKYSYLVGENKLLAVPSSADTVLLEEYRHDVYVHEGTAHMRLTAMLRNIKLLFKVELMAALEVIERLYGEQEVLFLSKEMEEAHLELASLRVSDSIEYGRAIDQWLKI